MTEPVERGLSATGSPGTEASAIGAGRKLLLVDDDAPLRRSMARALERRDFQVLAAEGVAEARSLAREHRPEFAVLDMRLTEGSGLDLVRTLRELRPEIRSGCSSSAIATCRKRRAASTCTGAPCSAS
jgi:ActR/RegA family two-component response regulator